MQKVKSTFLLHMQILKASAVNFYRDRCFFKASAISFSMFFTIMPFILLVISLLPNFSFFQNFIVQIKNILVDMLIESIDVHEYLDDFLKRSPSIDLLTFFGTLTASYLFIEVVEDSFDDIWKIGPKTKRSYGQKLLFFLSTIIIIPIVVSFSIYAVLIIKDFLSQAVLLKHLMIFFDNLIQIFFAWIIFSIIYSIVPRLNVDKRSAFYGGLFTAITWSVLKIGFNQYLMITHFYDTLYGAVSVIPIVMLWIYCSWVVILWGFEVVYVHHHKDNIDYVTKRKSAITYEEEVTINILSFLAKFFGSKTITISDIYSQTGYSYFQIKKSLSPFIDEKIVFHDENTDEVALIRNPKSITFSDIVYASSEDGKLIFNLSKEQEEGHVKWHLLHNMFLKEKDLDTALEKISLDYLSKTVAIPETTDNGDPDGKA